MLGCRNLSRQTGGLRAGDTGLSGPGLGTRTLAIRTLAIRALAVRIIRGLTAVLAGILIGVATRIAAHMQWGALPGVMGQWRGIAGFGWCVQVLPGRDIALLLGLHQIAAGGIRGARDDALDIPNYLGNLGADLGRRVVIRRRHAGDIDLTIGLGSRGGIAGHGGDRRV